MYVTQGGLLVARPSHYTFNFYSPVLPTTAVPSASYPKLSLAHFCTCLSDAWWWVTRFEHPWFWPCASVCKRDAIRCRVVSSKRAMFRGFFTSLPNGVCGSSYTGLSRVCFIAVFRLATNFLLLAHEFDVFQLLCWYCLMRYFRSSTYIFFKGGRDRTFTFFIVFL